MGTRPLVLIAGLLIGLLAAALVRTAEAQSRALARAHAHNDYLHERPLIDALRHGFTSVEADVHLVDGELLVAHDRSETEPGRTLESLYLRPLRHWVRAHGGVVHPSRRDGGSFSSGESGEASAPGSGLRPDRLSAPGSEPRPDRLSAPSDLSAAQGRTRPGGPSVQEGPSMPGDLSTPGGITLLIDVKSEAGPTYRAIDRALRAYADLFTVFAGDTLDPGPVTAIISGNRARDLIAAQPIRYAAIDGRPPDLNADPPAHLVPLVSTSWSTITDWRGEGPMPEEDRRRMVGMVERAHAQGRRIRFWATGDRPAVWKAELEAGVDLLNADDLGMLRTFLIDRAGGGAATGGAEEADG